jgi:hypothetical protein
MQIIHRRPGGRHADQAASEALPSRNVDASPWPPEPQLEPDVATAPAVTVVLSPGLVELAPGLSRTLGPGFSVTTDAVGAHGVMLVGPVGPAGVALLRASHPGVLLLVVDRRGRSLGTNEAVEYLEAGADGYLSNPVLA